MELLKIVIYFGVIAPLILIGGMWLFITIGAGIGTIYEKLVKK